MRLRRLAHALLAGCLTVLAFGAALDHTYPSKRTDITARGGQLSDTSGVPAALSPAAVELRHVVFSPRQTRFDGSGDVPRNTLLASQVLVSHRALTLDAGQLPCDVVFVAPSRSPPSRLFS